MKRIFTLLLCAALMLGCALPAAAVVAPGLGNFTRTNAYAAGQFTDVDESLWYGASQEGVVKAAYEFALMVGDGKSFTPSGYVTLAQAVTMAARLNSIYNKGTADFDESTGTAWYQVYLDYCVTMGIVTAGEFTAAQLNAAATRLQYARLIYKALPADALLTLNNVESGAIPDVGAENADNACVYKLYRAGITEGDSAHNFKPSEPISRVESAAMCVRVADTGLRRTFTLLAPTEEKPNEEAAAALLLARQANDAAQQALAAAYTYYTSYLASTDAVEKLLYLNYCRSSVNSAYEMALKSSQETDKASALLTADADLYNTCVDGYNHAVAAINYLAELYNGLITTSPTWPTASADGAAKYLVSSSTFLLRAYDQVK